MPIKTATDPPEKIINIEHEEDQENHKGDLRLSYKPTVDHEKQVARHTDFETEDEE